MKKKPANTERDNLINAMVATQRNIYRTQEQLRDLKRKLARQHAEYLKQTTKEN